jgi:galactonate dehydratase
MKITGVRTVIVNAEMRNWVFVRIETDQPGLHGWGEATLEWKTHGVAGCIEDFKPLLLGEDPTRIEHLYQKLYRHSFWRLGVVGMSAISGIEQACWDILGKELGTPVHRLLGGAVRDRVRMYTHLGGGQMEKVYETFDPGPLVDLAHQVVERGYTAVKVVFIPYSEPLMGPPAVKRVEAAMRALREGVGDEIDIMIDFHGRTSPAMAVQYIDAMAPYRPYFCEEPVPPENVAALAEVKRAVKVPIATGERLVTRFGFREIFETHAVHVIQPDLCHCGGLAEARKIAAMAETYYMGVAPHNPLGPVATAAAVHFDFATPNFLIQEDMLTDVPWRDDIVQSTLEHERGFWRLPSKPGLGIEVDEEAAKRHPYKTEVFHTTHARAADGAVLDW